MFFKSVSVSPVEGYSSKPPRWHVCIDCGMDENTRAASSPEEQLIREPAQLSWNRRVDVNTTEKVICSPWIHQSGMQWHKPNLSQHQHIINPHTSFYWKNLMNACLQKQYCNSASDRNILDLQSISFSYAMSAAYHKHNLLSESGFIFTVHVQTDSAKLEKELKTYCCDSSNMFQFSYKHKLQ